MTNGADRGQLKTVRQPDRERVTDTPYVQIVFRIDRILPRRAGEPYVVGKIVVTAVGRHETRGRIGRPRQQVVARPVNGALRKEHGRGRTRVIDSRVIGQIVLYVVARGILQ